MDVVILCGGKGSRLSEETNVKPKPMVEIGGKPILWHIMKTYSHYGFKKFVLALGYKAEYIKGYFYNHRITSSDFTLKLDMEIPPFFFNPSEERDWEITFVDTGEETLKGGRIKRLEKYIKTDQFHLTYGDGVCDINIANLVKFHNKHGKMGTVTAVHPPSRFGEMIINDTDVVEFDEKPQMASGYINGGYFIFKRDIFSYLTENKNCDFEFGALQNIVKVKQLQGFKHDGFWQCMDNVRERDYLDNLLKTNQAPWVQW
jgi:glucose-1-phosphate cytidylyltransferase